MKKQTNPKRKVTSFELDTEILLMLKEIAKQDRRSNAGMLSVLIMEEFKRRNLELPNPDQP